MIIKGQKIEWNKSKDDRDAITIIAGTFTYYLLVFAEMLRCIRSSNTEDFIPSEIKEDVSQNGKTTNYSYNRVYPWTSNNRQLLLEQQQQLYNLARGHALSQGRNYIIKDDISLVIKVVLSTGSIEEY